MAKSKKGDKKEEQKEKWETEARKNIKAAIETHKEYHAPIYSVVVKHFYFIFCLVVTLKT